MSYDTLLWVKAVHIFGILMWVGTLMGLYQCIFAMTATSADGRTALVELGRRIAAAMDIGAVIAMGSGIAMIFGIEPSPMKEGWFHVKLAVLLLFLASHVYGRITLGKIRKGGENQLPPVFFALLNAFLITIIIMAVVKPF